MARQRLSEREKPLSMSLSTQSTQYCWKVIHARRHTPFHGQISNIWYRKYGCPRPRNINVFLCVSIFGKYGFPSPCQAEVKISFNMLLSLYILCTEQLIFIPTFLSTLLTHSLPYNGFQQYAVNRCMACYVCSINLGEIFVPDLNFHRLIMLMHNLKGSLIMLLLLVLILLKAYLITNRNYINCKWLKCYLKICKFYSRDCMSFVFHNALHLLCLIVLQFYHYLCSMIIKINVLLTICNYNCFTVFFIKNNFLSCETNNAIVSR